MESRAEGIDVRYFLSPIPYSPDQLQNGEPRMEGGGRHLPQQQGLEELGCIHNVGCGLVAGYGWKR